MNKRLGYLDSLRGIAALMVLVFHSVLTFPKAGDPLFALTTFFNTYFDLGKISVSIFFIISGFVIPYSIKGVGLSAVKKFAISRIFRLYPAYWLSAILGFYIFKSFNFFELFMNLTMLQQFVGVENIIGLYWTLQIELIFYILIAIYFYLSLNNTKNYFFTSIGFLVFALFLSIFRYILEIKLPVALPIALSLMYFGSYLREYVINKNIHAKNISKKYLIIFFLLMPLICLLGYGKDMGQNESWYKYLITYYSSIILFLVYCKFKFTNNLFEFLGKISYSVYLFHPLVIELILTSKITNQLSPYLQLSLVLIITILISTIVYYTIENPAIGLSRKLKQNIK